MEHWPPKFFVCWVVNTVVRLFNLCRGTHTAAWQDLGIIPLYVADWKTNTNRTMTSDLRVSERSCSELQKSTILTQMESWLSAGVVRFSPGNALAVGCGHLHVVPARVEVPGSKPRVTLDPGREINDSLDKGPTSLSRFHRRNTQRAGRLVFG